MEYDMSIALLVNIDWWQPFQRTVHSMGGIYSSVLNLPREIRQKLENIFTIANIPGPSEPKTSQMNHILRPLVDELKLLERGIVIDGLRVRAKVFNWACDLPALRKTLGWLSHNANKGCTKCHQQLRKRPEDILKVGEKRTGREHREVGRRLQDMYRRGEKTRMENLETDTGVRYSIVNELDYHDPVKDHVIEPMHNLLIGVAKRIFQTFTSEGLVDITKMADRLEGILRSGLVRRLRLNFSWFTAHDWLEFLITGSVYGAEGLVSDNTMRIIQLLREAIEIYLRRTVKSADLTRADVLMKLALTRYAKIDKGSPNIHLALHISDDIRRFGPAPVYWAFSFERKNGVDGKLATNGNAKGIACQVMRKVDITSQTLQAGVTCSTKVSFSGKPKHQPANKVNVEELQKVVPTDIIRLERVTSAVLPWKEAVKRDDIIEIEDHTHCKVKSVLLINSTDVILEVNVFGSRVLTGDSAKAGPCYLTLSTAPIYVSPMNFVCKYKLITKDRLHILLPLRKKQCH